MSFIHCDICLRKENNPPLYGKIISKYGFDVHEFCLYSSDIPQRGKNGYLFCFLCSCLLYTIFNLQDAVQQTA